MSTGRATLSDPPTPSATLRIIPIRPVEKTAVTRQKWRTILQAGFFLLFIIAPPLDLLRYDLIAGHAWILGMEWRLGFDDFSAGRIDAATLALNLLLKLFLPIVVAAALFLFAAWKWGRLYCGWLCPHFSVVESINRLMIRASGKPSVWDRDALPPWQADGRPRRRDRHWWALVVPAAVLFALLWAVVLLSYLLPPDDLYARLFRFDLTRNQALFIFAATTVLSLEFLFARHLFCRFACAVGLFQSLAWTANRDAMVVGFNRERAADCARCLPDRASACEAACPMRLTPRTLKRHMFTWTQCAQCVDACATTQQHNAAGPLLQWVSDAAARTNESGFRSASLTQRRKESSAWKK